MTPVAITPAGRAASKKRAPAHEPARAAKSGTSKRSVGATVPGHRRRPRPNPAPKAPRRVSGPARERLADSLPPRPRTETRPPRTKIRTRTKIRRAPRRATGLPLRVRALAFAQGLPDHPLLDRLLRGRAWIPVLGVMLAGIVAMQVEVLKLGASVGRSIERSATLQASNDQLRVTVAALDGDQRIERMAAARGMIMPAPQIIGFLSAAQGADVHQAMANIHAPDATGFLSQTTSNGGTATVASSLAAASGGSSSGTPSSSSTSAAAQGSSAAAQDSSAMALGTTGTSSTATGASTAPVGTDPSQSSTSSSGGGGIPVGG